MPTLVTADHNADSDVGYLKHCMQSYQGFGRKERDRWGGNQDQGGGERRSVREGQEFGKEGEGGLSRMWRGSTGYGAYAWVAERPATSLNAVISRFAQISPVL
jgi:hypothetical protein